MIGPGTEVRDHDEAADSGILGGIHRPDRGVAVDGVRPLGRPPTGTRGPDDRVVPAEEIRQLLEVERLDVGHDGLSAGLFDVGAVLRIADDGGHRLAALGQERFEEEGDLAVAADDEGARGHAIFVSHETSLRDPAPRHHGVAPGRRIARPGAPCQLSGRVEAGITPSA